MPIFSCERKPLLRHLAGFFRNVYVFTENTFRFGIAQPVKGVALQRSIESRIDCIASALMFEVPTKNLIRSTILHELQKRETLTGSGNYPSLRHVLNTLQGLKINALSRDKRSQETACNRIDGILKALGAIFDVATGFPVEILNDISFSLELPQCNPEHRRTLAYLIMNELLQYRYMLWQRGVPLTVLTVLLDEASELASRHLETTSVTQGNQSTITELLTMGRELKIRVITLNQYGSPEDVSHAVIENSGVKVLLGGTGRADVLDHFAGILGCKDREHLDYMRTHRDPGTGYVNDIHYPHPFRVSFPFLPFKQHTAPDSLIQTRLEELLPRMNVTAPKPRWWREGMPLDVQPPHRPTEQQEGPATTSATPTPPPVPRQEVPDVRLTDTASGLLKALVDRETLALSTKGDPRLLAGLQPVWDEMKITSGRQKGALMKELLQANLVFEHRIRISSSTKTIVEVSDRGWALVGVTKPQIPGKGKWLHRVLARVISDHQKRRGYTCEIEGRISTSTPSGAKQADVLCRTPEGSLIAMEIAISLPFDKEVSNAKLDLLGDTPVDVITFVTTTSAILEKLKTVIASEADLQSVAHPTEKLIDFGPVDPQHIPQIVADGGTPMGAAVNMILDMIYGRKKQYRDTGTEYFQPWLVIMSDGQPTDSIEEAVRRTVDLVQNKKLTVFAIGIGDGADMDVLRRFSPNRQPLKLKGLNFKGFFEFLSKSVSAVSRSTPGQSVPLDQKGITGWAEV